MTSGNADSKELDNFLSRVDEINDLIRGLTLGDEQGVKDATGRADAYIKNNIKDPAEKTGFSKTVINKASIQDDAAPLNTGPHLTEGMSKDAFCAAIERDAAERSARRKEKLLVANKCKDEGNALFRLGKFEEAADAYTRGLEQIRDFKELYTNRAQTYIKLGRYKEALEDCSWALKVKATNAKAYVLQGKAHLALKEYDKAIDSYSQALHCDAKQEKTINAYIQEAELAKASAEQERQAAERLAAGATEQVTMAEALRRVKESGHILSYYRAALAVLDKLIQDDECKALFRTEGGFEMIESHSIIARCFCVEDVSVEEIAVCDAFLAVLVKVCDHNEPSQVKLLSLVAYRDRLMQFLDSSERNKKRFGTQLGVYRLLLSCSTSEAGAKTLVSNVDCVSLLNNTLTTIVEQTQPRAGRSRETPSLISYAVELLETLARHDRFKKKVSACASSSLALGALKTLLGTPRVQQPVLSIMTNLCSERSLQQAFANSSDIVETTLGLLPTNDDLKEGEAESYAIATMERTGLVLGLLLNMTLVAESPAVDTIASSLCCWCLRHCAHSRTDLAAGDGDGATIVLQRSLTLVGRLLRTRPKLAALLAEQGLKGGPKATAAAVTAHLKASARSIPAVTRAALATLACFTAHSETMTQEVLADRKALNAAFESLRSTDEPTVGNAALCLTRCLSVQPSSLAADAVRTATTPAVLKTLLPWARDASKDDVRQNCAILVARLTQLDTEYLEELRKLEGLGILHSCMKLIG